MTHLAELPRLAAAGAAAALLLVGTAIADEPAPLLATSAKKVPNMPWPAGGQKGMGNTQGPGTWARCAWHMSRPGRRC